MGFGPKEGKLPEMILQEGQGLLVLFSYAYLFVDHVQLLGGDRYTGAIF
jgi:hypothetical protein